MKAVIQILNSVDHPHHVDQTLTETQINYYHAVCASEMLGAVKIYMLQFSRFEARCYSSSLTQPTVLLMLIRSS